MFTASLGGWMVAQQGFEFILVLYVLAAVVGDAVLTWLAYLMLEPYARAHWPRTLVSWNRLLQGRWRDPMVGRDLAIGACAGLLVPIALLFDEGTLSAMSPSALLWFRMEPY